jgi:hypothetical protein
MKSKYVKRYVFVMSMFKILRYFLTKSGLFCLVLDWGGWNRRDSVEGESFSRKEDSNLSMADAKSDSVYDGSNIGASVVHRYIRWT